MVIVLMGVFLWFGARARWQNMPETDKAVFGAWSGTVADTSGSTAPAVYLFWSNGIYTIRPISHLGPNYESGNYKTSAGENGAVLLQLIPDKKHIGTSDYAGMGAERILEVHRENINGSEFLVFPDGSRYSESSLDVYAPLPY